LGRAVTATRVSHAVPHRGAQPPGSRRRTNTNTLVTSPIRSTRATPRYTSPPTALTTTTATRARTRVEPGSSADEAGIRRGDVILEVNREPVKDLPSYRNALKASKSKSVLFLVRRGDNTIFMALKPNQ